MFLQLIDEHIALCKEETNIFIFFILVFLPKIYISNIYNQLNENGRRKKQKKGHN